MTYKRILTIQDISCVGQCSTTVALPVLSACGYETCILPTALLSTHTGGFGTPSIVHFENALEQFRRHWQENHITFDAVLVGYLGSPGAVETTAEILDSMVAPGGLRIVDPAMGDNGKLYSGFDDSYVRSIRELIQRADIILPNLTEAALLTGLPFREDPKEKDINELLDALDHPCALLTGVCPRSGETGFVLRSAGRQDSYFHRRIGQNRSGTGDIFAAAFAGALLREKSLYDAARIAADFTCLCVENTERLSDHWYGLAFEPVLSELIGMLKEPPSA